VNLHTINFTDSTSYVQRLSAGMVFTNPNNETITSMWSKDSKSYLFRADVMAYLNILGIIYVLIHSICLRKMLNNMTTELDNADISPKDYGILVKKIPKTTTSDDLKKMIENEFNNEV